LSIEVVSTTRLNAEDFATSPLGVSLQRLARDTRLSAAIAYENHEGLPTVYNRRIDANSEADILAFVHDDVWLEDFYFTDRVAEALKTFDIVGLAGSRTRRPGQVTWDPGVLDRTQPRALAGAIGQGDAPLGKIAFFGPIIAEVKLLDGVFIAARRSALKAASVRFDERFAFHLYDLDFSRTADRAGLHLGTFPLSVTHRSLGGFFTPEWKDAAIAYLEKWGD
jgi:GT2 family glycosyltransferase